MLPLVSSVSSEKHFLERMLHSSWPGLLSGHAIPLCCYVFIVLLLLLLLFVLCRRDESQVFVCLCSEKKMHICYYRV